MIQKSIAAGVVVEGILDDLQVLGLVVEPFTPEDGAVTGQLWQQTRQYGLSLGDRASFKSRAEAECSSIDERSRVD